MAYPIINIFTQSRINSFGTNAIVAWGINGKVDFIVWMMVEAIAVSVATFTAKTMELAIWIESKKEYTPDLLWQHVPLFP